MNSGPSLGTEIGQKIRRCKKIDIYYTQSGAKGHLIKRDNGDISVLMTFKILWDYF